MSDEAYTQEEAEQAAAEEQQALSMSVPVLMAQNKHLSDRVVLLRAEVNRLQKQINQLTHAQPQDRRPAKKTTTRKPSRN